MEKCGSSRLFGIFFGALEPLGRFWDTFWSLWGTLGQILKKIAESSPKGTQKGWSADPLFTPFQENRVRFFFMKNVENRR